MLHEGYQHASNNNFQGFNTTLTLRTHEGSIPSQPALGRALKGFEFEMPTPSLHGPPQDGDDDDDDDEDDSGPHFIKDATVSNGVYPREGRCKGRSFQF